MVIEKNLLDQDVVVLREGVVCVDPFSQLIHSLILASLLDFSSESK
jgi:hypothetical protein